MILTCAYIGTFLSLIGLTSWSELNSNWHIPSYERVLFSRHLYLLTHPWLLVEFTLFWFFKLSTEQASHRDVSTSNIFKVCPCPGLLRVEWCPLPNTTNSSNFLPLAVICLQMFINHLLQTPCFIMILISRYISFLQQAFKCSSSVLFFPRLVPIHTHVLVRAGVSLITYAQVCIKGLLFLPVLFFFFTHFWLLFARYPIHTCANDTIL